MLAVRIYQFWQRGLNALFTKAARRAFASLGRGTNLQLPIQLKDPRNVALGNKVVVYPGAILRSELGGTIEVGDGTLIFERVTITSQERVTIGSRVLISRNVHISDHDHNWRGEGAVMDQGMTVPAPVSIGSGAWIGHGVVVGPGVSIGSRAVVGANSVVTADVPDGCLAVGAPARVVRQPN